MRVWCDLSFFFFWWHYGHHTLFHCEYVYTCSRTHCNHICGWPHVSTRQRGCCHVASLMMFIWWLQDRQRHERAASVIRLTSRHKSHQLKLSCLSSVTIARGNGCKHSSPQKQGTSHSVLEAVHCGLCKKRQRALDVCHVLTSSFIYQCCCLFNDWDKTLLSGHNAVTLLTSCSMPVECVAICLLIGKLMDLSMPLHHMFVWTVMLQPCAYVDETAMLRALKNILAPSLQLFSRCQLSR